MAVTKDSERLIELHREFVQKGGFKAFVKIAWPMIEPKPIIWEPHMDLVCAHLEAVLRGEIKDLVINVPPGTSKSTITSVLFPVYCWIVDPTLKFLFTSYSERLSMRFARRALRLLCSDWFKARWPHVSIIDETRANVSEYDNTAGGYRISTMMGGEATGRHADILLVDDPHKPKDLMGDPDAVKKLVEDAWETWVDTFSTRRADAATFRRVCIMQRLHECDIAGMMIQEPDTVHLCLPMEYEPSRHCKTDWGEDFRTEEGQLLCPMRFPRSVIEKEKVRMSPRSYASQHQQRPAPKDGILFKTEYFQNLWSTVPRRAVFYMSIDANLKERKDTDRAIIQVWCVEGPFYYCIDQIGDRWGFGDLVKNIKLMKQKWPQVTTILIEDKANGTAVIDVLKKTIPGIEAVNPEGGKWARAESIEWLLRANNVLFPAHQAKWVLDLMEEARTFPAGVHDDTVDAMTQFLVWIIKHGTRRTRFKKAMQNVKNGYGFHSTMRRQMR